MEIESICAFVLGPVILCFHTVVLTWFSLWGSHSLYVFTYVCSLIVYSQPSDQVSGSAGLTIPSGTWKKFPAQHMYQQPHTPERPTGRRFQQQQQHLNQLLSRSVSGPKKRRPVPLFDRSYRFSYRVTTSSTKRVCCSGALATACWRTSFPWPLARFGMLWNKCTSLSIYVLLFVSVCMINWGGNVVCVLVS